MWKTTLEGGGQKMLNHNHGGVMIGGNATPLTGRCYKLWKEKGGRVPGFGRLGVGGYKKLIIRRPIRRENERAKPGSKSVAFLFQLGLQGGGGDLKKSRQQRYFTSGCL